MQLAKRRGGTVAAARAIAAVVAGVAAVAVIAAAVVVAVITVAVAAVAITAVVGVTAAARVGVVGAATVGTGIGIAAAMIAHEAVAVAHRLGDIITVEIMTMTVIEIMTATDIAITAASISTGEIGIVMIVIATITARASISPRIMAAMVIARTLTSVVTKTAYTRARRMRSAGKATTRNVHTFTSMARPASSLFSAVGAHTNKLIETASCAAMKKAISIMKPTSPADTFTVSDSFISPNTKVVEAGCSLLSAPPEDALRLAVFCSTEWSRSRTSSARRLA